MPLDKTGAPMDFPDGDLGGSNDGAKDLAKGLIDPVIATFDGIPTFKSPGQLHKEADGGGFDGTAA